LRQVVGLLRWSRTPSPGISSNWVNNPQALLGLIHEQRRTNESTADDLKSTAMAMLFRNLPEYAKKMHSSNRKGASVVLLLLDHQPPQSGRQQAPQQAHEAIEHPSRLGSCWANRPTPRGACT
jgi:hypothetical protein